MVQALGWFLLAEALQAEGGAEYGERVEKMELCPIPVSLEV